MRFMRIHIWALVLLLCPSTLLPAGNPKESRVLQAMAEELERSVQKLKGKEFAPLYHLSYEIVEETERTVRTSYGAIQDDSEDRARYLDVDVRVGSPELDNTHAIRGGSGFDWSFYSRGPERICVEDDPDAIRAALWLATDREFKGAQERLTKVKTDVAVKVEEEDQSPDFSTEAPHVHIGELASLELDTGGWPDRLRRWSDRFSDYPLIYSSGVSLAAVAENKFLVNSEGTRIQTGQTRIRLSIRGQTKAADGMELYRYSSFHARALRELPDEDTVLAAIDKIIEELTALRDAPVVEPYIGPAILMNRASGVFFHEIFGHRIEGHRQKRAEEGQTFTKKVGEQILPDFISVYDDPTLESYQGEMLRGHYKYDDEGVPAQRVTVVEKGVLKNFLMSRSPIKGFPKSNGHGRRQYGRKVVSRQGNLTVDSENTVPFDELREMLIAECKRQGKPYGLIFEDISGGFTMTGRWGPQAFKVIPLLVYRVYADRRPDEVVRGVDIVGTPLTSFSKIVATGDDYGVFNGTCGAESGWVPVSAVSPSILVSEIEVEKKRKGQEKPPILPPPGS